VIRTRTALADLVARIAATDRVGIDTEADSLHCYQEKVCLVQVGLPGADELVDPLAGLDLTPLLDALAHTEIVMHGADFDLRMLYRLGFGTPSKVFDTMIAARLVGTARYGYAALVDEHFGVALPKGLQRANWALRPLAPRLAEYACNDTRYLLPLADRLERRLTELGRLAWLEQACRRAVDAARVTRAASTARGLPASATPKPSGACAAAMCWGRGQAPCCAPCGTGGRRRRGASIARRFTSCRTRISSTLLTAATAARRRRHGACAGRAGRDSRERRTKRWLSISRSGRSVRRSSRARASRRRRRSASPR